LNGRTDLDQSDIPLLPSKEFVKEFLKEMEDEDYDLLHVIKLILRNEIEGAKQTLERNSFDCKNEEIVGLITLNAIEKAIEIFNNIVEYKKSKDEKLLEKASEDLDVLLGLIRASGKPIPVRVQEMLTKCCVAEQSSEEDATIKRS